MHTKSVLAVSLRLKNELNLRPRINPNETQSSADSLRIFRGAS